MTIGNLIHDHALKMHGIIVDGAHVEVRDPSRWTATAGDPIEWEWLVLYEDGELMGADALDLRVVK